MKITIATGPIFPVPAVRGGAVQRLWEGLAREFVKRGHEVTIFAREFPGQASEETVDGIRYVRRGGYEQSTSIKRDLVQCLLYALKTARHVPPGDVVVTNDFWMPAVLPWLNRSSGKVVASIARFPKQQCFLYKECAALPAVSETVAAEIRRQTPRLSHKVYVVHNNVDSAFIDSPVAPKTKNSGSVRILFVGRLHPEKGLELLLDALALLRQASGHLWECEIIGPTAEAEGGGGEKYFSQLRKKAEGLPVFFSSPVYGPRKLASVYDTANVFVYPSVAETGESFGVAPLEAMARGIVPVVTDLAVFREFIKPGVNGVVFDHRSKDAAKNLAAVLQGLIANAGDRTRMGAAARKTAERFSPAVIADKYLQLFEKVISGR